jgi:hypothetical protein
MITQSRFNIFVLAFLFLISSCSKTTTDNVAGPDPVTPSTVGPGKDQIAIIGTVVLETGYPAVAVNVNIDGHLVQTDENGYFNFTGKVANIDEVIIKIIKPGYFDFYRTMVVENEATYSDVKFSLMPEITAGSFSAVAGGAATSEVVDLNFAPNSFLNEAGSVYNGTVNVKMPNIYYDYINDSAYGDARGIDKSNTPVALSTFGSFPILFRGELGEKLKLSKPVTFSYKKAEVAGFEPLKKIKVWAYNVTSARWIEEGEASMINKKIVGTATNTDYIRLATSHPPALLKANLYHTNFFPAASFSFYYSAMEENYFGRQKSIANSNGVCLLYVPAAILARGVLFSLCGDDTKLFGIAPIPAGTTSEQGFIVDLSEFFTSISGSVNDCDFNPVEGRAELHINNKIYNSPVTNGRYKFDFFSCDRSQSYITVYDKNEKVLVKSQLVAVTHGLIYETSAITTCTRLTKGTISIVAEGITYTFNSSVDTIDFTFRSNGVSVLNVVSADKKRSLSLFFESAVVGKPCPVVSLNLTLPDKYYLSYYPQVSNHTFMNFTKIREGNVDMEGTFKAQLYISGVQSNATDVSGSFKIEH